MDAWLIWLIIAVVLLAVEMLTITAAVGMLGVAALITAGFAALGLPVPVQLLAFTVTATIGVLLIRPIVRRHMLRPQLERFGVEALIGKPAYVVSEVSGVENILEPLDIQVPQLGELLNKCQPGTPQGHEFGGVIPTTASRTRSGSGTA